MQIFVFDGSMHGISRELEGVFVWCLVVKIGLGSQKSLNNFSKNGGSTWWPPGATWCPYKLLTVGKP
jgi:hypothetical protein